MEEKWEYINDAKNKNRYILGKKGENILYCMGINPSTAEPNNLDQTLKVVEKMMEKKGYDGWIMLNIYPQRATNPDELDNKLDIKIHKINIREIEKF